jgi:hypothetical protein
MLWVTRHTIRVNRTATAWLVRRFVDPRAAFCFVEPDQVAGVEEREGAIGFDAPGARYPHQDRRGRCSFEALVDEFLPLDPALRELARMVHVADFPGEAVATVTPGQSHLSGSFDLVSPCSRAASRQGAAGSPVPEASGLRMISRGFPLITSGDHETLARSAFLYDALYASIQASLPQSFTPSPPRQ